MQDSHQEFGHVFVNYPDLSDFGFGAQTGRDIGEFKYIPCSSSCCVILHDRNVSKVQVEPPGCLEKNVDNYLFTPLIITTETPDQISASYIILPTTRPEYPFYSHK